AQRIWTTPGFSNDVPARANLCTQPLDPTLRAGPEAAMEQDDLTASQGLKNGMIDGALIAGARNAAQHAYAPYSGSLVGAALRTARGGIYVGCNVENAAFPLTLCAERAAIAAAVLAEGRDCRIVEIAIHAEDARGEMLSAAPCGGCRQCIHEMGTGTL